MTIAQISSFVICATALVFGYIFGRYTGHDYGFRAGYLAGMRVKLGGINAKTSE